MPKKPSKPRRPATDPNTAAKSAVDALLARHETREAPREKDEYMSAMGRKGGLVSGARRKANLTPEQRQEIARKGAAARWGKRSG